MTTTKTAPPRETLSATTHADSDWRDHALCADDPNPDRWVDLPPIRRRGKNNPAYDEHLNELRAVCDGCPVIDNCLWGALGHSVRGVFAGTDEFERADLRDSLGLPTPPRIPPAENEEDERLLNQQFAALRLARRGFTNIQIAETLGVSPMTVSRLFAHDDHPTERRPETTEQPHPQPTRSSDKEPAYA